ncbi:MAG: type II toxin-antitoxin system Phd/YefM family antitoxin [Solirubrobacteraceae bacterium]
MAWQLQAAKQRFSELVERARTEGPQVVTKHGKEAVVVLAAEEYHRLRGDQPSLLDYLRAAPDLDALELDRARDLGREVEL